MEEAGSGRGEKFEPGALSHRAGRHAPGDGEELDEVEAAGPASASSGAWQRTGSFRSGHVSTDWVRWARIPGLSAPEVGGAGRQRTTVAWTSVTGTVASIQSVSKVSGALVTWKVSPFCSKCTS